MDPRTGALLDALVGHTPIDAREDRSLRVLRGALGQLALPFDAEADPTHVTASAVVTGRRGVLLHRHKRLGVWLQPGGHVDAGESPLHAAQRELAEETGIRAAAVSAAVLHVDVHPGGRGHTHLDVRYHFTADADPAPPADESPAVAWFAWTEAARIADAGLRGALTRLGGSPVAGTPNDDGRTPPR